MSLCTSSVTTHRRTPAHTSHRHRHKLLREHMHANTHMCMHVYIYIYPHIIQKYITYICMHICSKYSCERVGHTNWYACAFSLEQIQVGMDRIVCCHVIMLLCSIVATRIHSRDCKLLNGLSGFGVLHCLRQGCSMAQWVAD